MAQVSISPKCVNHSDREAQAYCRSCGKGLCRECMVVREDMVYCHGDAPAEAPAAQARQQPPQGWSDARKSRIAGWGIVIALAILILVFVFAFLRSGTKRSEPTASTTTDQRREDTRQDELPPAAFERIRKTDPAPAAKKTGLYNSELRDMFNRVAQSVPYPIILLILVYGVTRYKGIFWTMARMRLVSHGFIFLVAVLTDAVAQNLLADGPLDVGAIRALAIGGGWFLTILANQVHIPKGHRGLGMVNGERQRDIVFPEGRYTLFKWFGAFGIDPVDCTVQDWDIKIGPLPLMDDAFVESMEIGIHPYVVNPFVVSEQSEGMKGIKNQIEEAVASRIRQFLRNDQEPGVALTFKTIMSAGDRLTRVIIQSITDEHILEEHGGVADVTRALVDRKGDVPIPRWGISIKGISIKSIKLPKDLEEAIRADVIARQNQEALEAHIARLKVSNQNASADLILKAALVAMGMPGVSIVDIGGAGGGVMPTYDVGPRTPQSRR